MARAFVIAAVVLLGVAYLNGYLGHRRRTAHPGATGTVTAVVPHRDVVLAWAAVAAVPVLCAVWFATSLALFADVNDPSARRGWEGVGRVLLWWGIVAVIPALGIVCGRRALRRNEPRARAALAANVFVFAAITAVTLSAGLIDVLA